MPLIYQTSLDIPATTDKGGHALFRDIGDRLRQSVAKATGEKAILESASAEWSIDGNTVRLESDSLDELGSLNLTWLIGDDVEQRFYVSTLGDHVQVEVGLYGPENLRETMPAPPIVGELISTFDAQFREEVVRDEILRIDEANAEWYASSLIFSPGRKLPIVAVSEFPGGSEDDRPARLSEFLQGVATVVTYSSDVGRERINRLLGRLGCSGGEIRVYAPRATSDDAPALHRNWNPKRFDVADIRQECLYNLSLLETTRLYYEVREEMHRRWDAEQAEQEEREDQEYQQRILDLDNTVSNLREEIAGYKDSTSKLEDDLDATTTQLVALQSERDGANARLIDLQSDLSQINQELSRLRNENEALQQQADQHADELARDVQYQTLIRNLRGQRDLLKENVAQAQSEARQKENQIQGLILERDGLATKLENLETERMQTEQQLHSSLAAKGKDLDEAHERIALLEAKGDSELQTSTKRTNRIAKAEDSRRIGELERKIEYLNWTINQRDDKIDYLSRRLAESDNGHSDRSTGIDKDSGLTASEPASVSEVVLNAQRLPGLRFLDSAFSSAKDSPFRYLGRLERAFRALSDLAQIQAGGRALGIPFENWFQYKNLDYVAHEGEQAMKKSGRDFTDDLCRIPLPMPEHIRFGKGGNRDPKDILRIHFAWCEKEDKLLIGWVGRHLPNART